MEALRQILDVKNNRLDILLPADFKAETVEVIILPLEVKEKKKSVANLRGKLNLLDSQYIDFQNNIKNSREGWEKSF